ncbi:MAG TPA: hypothetical protein VL981_09105, partial [Candidatus Methylacidiphilales bacterium]|nr:hypothetical protein [Candidatus Methylacidiphilales bacterium]
MNKKQKLPAATPAAKMRVPAQPATQDWMLLGKFALILAAGFWIYWPVLNGDWLWDDDTLVSQNPMIHDPAGIWHIWFRPSELIDYFPLTASVQWLEWQLWPNSTFCFHFTNVVL